MTELPLGIAATFTFGVVAYYLITFYPFETTLVWGSSLVASLATAYYLWRKYRKKKQ